MKLPSCPSKKQQWSISVTVLCACVCAAALGEDDENVLLSELLLIKCRLLTCVMRELNLFVHACGM